MSVEIKFLNEISFREYLEVIKYLTFRSIKIIWHILWIFGFILIAYISYKDFVKNPENLNDILKSQILTYLLLLTYPLFLFFQYCRNYHSKNSIFKEKLNIEVNEESLFANNDFYSKKIDLTKVEKVQFFKNYILIYFYQDFLLLNVKILDNKTKNELLTILNKKNSR